MLAKVWLHPQAASCSPIGQTHSFLIGYHKELTSSSFIRPNSCVVIYLFVPSHVIQRPAFNGNKLWQTRQVVGTTCFNFHSPVHFSLNSAKLCVMKQTVQCQCSHWVSQGWAGTHWTQRAYGGTGDRAAGVVSHIFMAIWKLLLNALFASYVCVCRQCTAETDGHVISCASMRLWTKLSEYQTCWWY